jgi:SP family sugar:H+ symporter-like MFS transporter
MLTFGFFYVWLCIPETKGLSLEEVDEMYRTGVKPWRSAEWKPHQKHLAHAHHDGAGTPTEKPTVKQSENGM